MGAPSPLTLADELLASKPRLVAFLVLVAPLVALAASFRLLGLSSHGLDVDEASNLAVGLAAFRTGIPAFPPELGALSVPYLSHPAFGYDLLGLWFRLAGPSIEAARLISAIASLGAIVLLAAWFVRHHGVIAAILVSTFVGLDGWIVLTNRSNFLENAQLIPLVAGMWLFARAVRSSRTRDFLLAGLALGAVVVFKHIGLYIALAVVLDWLIARRHGRGYALLLVVLGVVFVGYLGWMDLRFDGLYSANQLHQVKRVLGIIPAPGQNIGAGDAAGAVLERYFIFVTTIVAFVVGVPAVFIAYVRRLRASLAGRGESDVLLAWAVAGILAAAGSQLRSPHYLVLWLIPLYAWLAVRISAAARGRRAVLVPVLIVAFVAASLGTWHLRFSVDYWDAIAAAASYIDEELPADAVVGADPFLGGLLARPYVRIDREPPAETLREVTHFAIYTSRTTAASRYTSGVATAMVDCRAIASFSGFKDRVVLCERPAPGRAVAAAPAAPAPAAPAPAGPAAVPATPAPGPAAPRGAGRDPGPDGDRRAPSPGRPVVRCAPTCPDSPSLGTPVAPAEPPLPPAAPEPPAEPPLPPASPEPPPSSPPPSSPPASERRPPRRPEEPPRSPRALTMRAPFSPIGPSSAGAPTGSASSAPGRPAGPAARRR